MKSFLLKFFIFSFLIALGNYFWNNFIPEKYIVPGLWFSYAFFIVITLSFHFISMNAAKGRPQNFIRFYMGATALKMFLCVLIVLVYIFKDKPTATPFALGFFAQYFLFSIFEVTSLLKLLRK